MSPPGDETLAPGKEHTKFPARAQQGQAMGAERSRARQLFIRARQIGISAKNKTPYVVKQIVEADNNLAALLESEDRKSAAEAYKREAAALASNKSLDVLTQMQLTNLEHKFDEVDNDGDGKASLKEMQDGLKAGIISPTEFQEWQDKLASAAGAKTGMLSRMILISKPTVVGPGAQAGLR